MKALCLSLIFGVCTFCLFALGIGDNSDKFLDLETHSSGNFSLGVDNNGCFRDLIYPATDGAKYLFFGGSWISAKRYRRDASGDLLYWLAQNPSSDSSAVVTQSDPLWNPTLKVVTDSLTSVGFDGDKDLFELLPVYNPLMAGNAQTTDLYETYNILDCVLRSIQGYPAPIPFCYPDSSGTYCFTQAQDFQFETPGYETLSAYYYDFCPFGTVGDRDLGQSMNTNTHYPLGLAIHQESYAWNQPDLNSFAIIKKTLYNTSTVDTLFDLTIAEYVDCDVKPLNSGPEGASDDVSGYVKGNGYEFAYSRDYDGDGGLAPNIVAHKFMLPGFAGNHTSWYWNVGNGPDDYNARNLTHPGRLTANEKYWLCSGRNPNITKYHALRPEQDDVWEFEQPNPMDTRFLTAYYGSIPTADLPDPAGRLHLNPGESISYYSIVFVGSSVADLKRRSQAIESFITSGFTDNESPELVQNNTLCVYPNPFNPSTTVSFSLPESGAVELSIYNIKGQKIRELLSSKLSQGNHLIVWDGTDSANKTVVSGLYFCRMTQRNLSQTRKMLMLK